MSRGASPVVALVAASGASWETAVLEVLDTAAGVVVLKRCVDLDDLLASAASGQADAAVVGIDAHGLDAAALDLLARHGVVVVAVVPEHIADERARERGARVGLRHLVPESGLASLPEILGSARSEGGRGASRPPESAKHPSGDEAEIPSTTPSSRYRPGRVVVVWGPAGAPGRTTVAAGLAAAVADRDRIATLVDADPWGGAVAQQLGILDEVSGLLAATRLVTRGNLGEGLDSVQRSLNPTLRVVTGLPRAERWSEVRAGVLEQLLEATRARGEVVVDTGFCLEDDASSGVGVRSSRNGLTLEALGTADDLVVVGTADPVGLARLARGLVDVAGLVRPGTAVHVVVNRMRSTLGWSQQEVEQMVRGFTRVESLTFVPDDRSAVDRALVTGRSVVEQPDAPCARALGDLVDVLVGAPSGPGRGGATVRRRRAGRARRR
ncbi:hypothetical protein ISG29_11755 [Nocardioides sp. CBS4Y-1]|uniref:MinD-like ATPase involved in chromosome partitioning or flagellar assembly n=1 Tax=Nocardioides acrostichi TaxID=2784339 RepID=A0A930Y7U7_9ACTN|nr:hypothetical protein [Nocardioides acrostichi]